MSRNNIGIDLNLKTRMARDKTSGLSKSFVQLSKDGKSADTSIGGLTSGLGALKSAISVVGIYKLTNALGKATSAAADIRESVHMYNIAMGDFAESTAVAVDELTELSGIDPIKYLDSVGEFNLLARSMGVTAENSAVLSENVNRLALDLSALTNRDILKVQEDFKSGLLGRSRTVYKYGIDITEAALAQEALNQGIQKSVRHMSQSEKMQLRYQIMIKSTGLAHGDFSNTIESPANQMRIFSDRILTATRSLGTIFIPMLTKVMPYLNAFAKMLNVVFQSLAKLVGYDAKANEAIKNTGDTFGDATGELEDGMEDAGKEASDTAKKVDKLKKKVQQLAGFDELNILGKHETPVQPTTPKKEKKKAEDYTGPLDFNLEGYDSNIKGIAQKTDEIFKTMMDWMKKVQEAAEPTTKALAKLWNEGLKEFRNFSAQALKDFYTEFLVPVGKWTLGEDGLARFFRITNRMLKDINWKSLNGDLVNFWQALAPFQIAIGIGLLDFYEQVLVPIGVWTFNDAIPRLLNAITDALNRIDWDHINENLREFFDLLGTTTIGSLDILVRFYEMVLIPIAEWTIGTGLPKLLEILTKGMMDIKWDKINDAFDNLFSSLAPFGEIIGKGLLWLFDKVLVPLELWTTNDILPVFLDLLAGILDVLAGVIENLNPIFGAFWDIVIVPIAKFTGGVIVKFLEGFVGVLELLADMLNNEESTFVRMTGVVSTFILGWGAIKTFGLIKEVGGFGGAIKLLGGKLLGAVSGIGKFSGAMELTGGASLGMGGVIKGAFSSLFSPAGAVIVGAAAGLWAISKLAKYMSEDAIGDVEIFGEGVSKSTERAVGAYLELEEEATTKMNEINWSGQVITADMTNEITKLYSGMNTQVISELENQRTKSLKVLDGISEDTLKNNKGLKEDTVRIVRETYDGKIKLAENREERIAAIYEGAAKENRQLNNNEKKEIAKINEDMKKDAISTLSSSKKEQLIIMDNLKREGNKITAKSAADIVKTSLKRKKDTIKEADEEYYGQMEIAEMLRREGTEESIKAADEITREAKRQREDTIKEAETMHENVVKEAKAQAKGHVKEVDWETGEVLSRWEVMSNGVGNWMSDMVEAAKKLPGEMGRGIRNGASSFKKAMADMWDDALDGISKPVNGIIGAANWILTLFGADPLKKWNPSSSRANIKVGGGDGRTYAKGTDGHPGGPAVVNDATGSTYRELIEFPDGKRIIPKRRNVKFDNMPKGTKVLPAHLTAKLPHYKGGIGDWWKGVKNKGKDIWDFIKQPAVLAKNAIQRSVSYDNLSNLPLDMAKGLTKRVTSPMTDWVKGLFKKNEHLNPAYQNDYGGVGFPSPPFRKSSSYGYRTHPITGQKGRFHHGIDLAAPMGTPVNAQIGGKVNRAGWMGGYGNTVMVAQGRAEQLYAHLSKILTSQGRTVKAGQRIGLVGSSGDSTGPHLHYEKRMGGSSMNPGNPLYNPSTVSGKHSPNVERWRTTVQQALKMNNLPTSPAYVEAWLRQINTESSGNPKNIQSVKDINWRTGNLARGLVQVIPPTFNRYSHKGHKDPFNALDSLLAGMNYAKSRYGTKGMLNAIGKGRGYAKGGFITGMTSFNVAGESGHEGIVPLEGRHMMPFADAIAERLGEYTQTAIDKNNSTNGNNNTGGVIVQIGERTLVDILGSEINRKSKINGKSVIRV